MSESSNKSDEEGKTSIFGKMKGWAVATKDHYMPDNEDGKFKKLESEDGYLASHAERRRYQQLANANLVEGTVGSGTIIEGQTEEVIDKDGNRVIQRSDTKAGKVTDTLQKWQEGVDKFANPKDDDGEPTNNWFTYLKKSVKAVNDNKRMLDNGGNVVGSALAAIDEHFPLGLSKACQAIIDNFKSNLPPRKSRHESYFNGVSSLLGSDEAQCAMDALEFLLPIKGLKDHITGFVLEIEAMANVAAGILTTIIDYDLIEDFLIDDIWDMLTKDTAPPGSQTYYLACTKVIKDNANKGRTEYVEWAGSKLGYENIISIYPDVIKDLVANYQWSGDGSDELFAWLLFTIDPEWFAKNGVYSMDIFGNVSVDALRYFETRDDFRSLSLGGKIKPLEGSIFTRLPTVGEVTGDLYPLAVDGNNNIIIPEWPETYMDEHLKEVSKA